MIDILIYSLIGLSLSIDALSAAISYGTVITKQYEKILMISFIGLFHFLMPIIGTLISKIIENKIMFNIKYIVFIIYSLLVIEMINEDSNINIKKIDLLKIFLISVLVSIDSFSIGIVIGLNNGKIVLASVLFSIISSVATFIGINIGNMITQKNRKIAKILGVSLLIITAIKYLLY